MLGSVFVYAGLILAFGGTAMAIKPLRRLGFPSRRRALVAVGTGLALIAIGWLLPAHESRSLQPRTQLDRITPIWQFSEHHTVRIAAPPASVFQAIRQVTAGEIAFFRALTWIRRLGRPGPESILNAPERQPLLEVAMRGGFVLLADEPDREIVIGTVVVAPPGARGKALTPESFAAIDGQPGFASATMNFLLEPDGAGATILSTETRVCATDPASNRAFARYWRVIYPGSALIRRMWLRAIKLRAESQATVPSA